MGYNRKKELKNQKLQKQNDRALKEQVRKKKERSIAIIVLSVVLALTLIVVGSFAIHNAVKNTGNYLRKNISLKSGDYKIDNTMLNYYFKNACYNFVQSEEFNNEFDLSMDLKEQYTNDGQSWHDYFMDIAVSRAKQSLLFAQEAESQGITLSDEDYTEINATLDEINPDNIQQGVKRSDLQKCLELNKLADKYYQTKYSKVNLTDKKLQEFVNSHPEQFETVSYRSFSFNYEDMNKKFEGMPKAEAKEYAEDLAACKNEQEFLEFVTDYFIKTNEGWTELDAEAELEYTLSVDVARTDVEDQQLCEWLFDKDTKQFDTRLIDDVEHACFNIQMVVKQSGIDNSYLPTVRHILLTDAVYETDKETKKKAQNVLNQFLDGKQTEDEFSALVEKYSEDTGSVRNGGLYSNIEKGAMVEEFEEWCFDKNRKTGDTGIVKTEYGYHIMYFVNKQINWYSSAEEAYYTEWHDNLVAELEEKYPITEYPENYKQIKL